MRPAHANPARTKPARHVLQRALPLALVELAISSCMDPYGPHGLPPPAPMPPQQIGVQVHVGYLPSKLPQGSPLRKTWLQVCCGFPMFSMVFLCFLKKVPKNWANQDAGHCVFWQSGAPGTTSEHASKISWSCLWEHAEFLKSEPLSARIWEVRCCQFFTVFLFVACDNGVEANGSNPRSDTTSNKVSRLAEVRAESCATLHLWHSLASFGFLMFLGGFKASNPPEINEICYGPPVHVKFHPPPVHPL